MKKIITGILYLVLVFSFGGCGNGSSSSEEESKAKKHIPLEKCSEVVEMESYTLLNSNDEIISDEENSTVLRYYSEKGVKRVCILEGDAHVEREVLD